MPLGINAASPRWSKGRKSTAYSSLLSCSPPPVSATSSDELQSAAWGGGELRGLKSRRSPAHFRARQHPIHRPRFARFGLRAPRVGQRPSAHARRFEEPQKHVQQLGPTRRENRSRFSRLKNKHSPKHSPVLRPVSASLRLRFRSAAFSRAWGNLVKTHRCILTVSLFKAAAREDCNKGCPPWRERVRRAGGASRHSESAASTSRLFREATQLKTMVAVVHVAGTKVLRRETQKYAMNSANGRRPTVPVAADAPQRTLVAAAVARGGKGRQKRGRRSAERRPRAY